MSNQKENPHSRIIADSSKTLLIGNGFNKSFVIHKIVCC